MTRVKHETASQPIFPPDPPKPRCPLCQQSGCNLEKLTTRTSNRNGNANRPYLKCSKCDKFVTFLDDRGTHPVNPKCECHVPSRLQVASFCKGRKLHFVCSTGHCRFYELARDREYKPIDLAEDYILKFATLRSIQGATKNRYAHLVML
jgi:hypothetical protein